MSKLLDAIIENYYDEELSIADGFNEAVIGIDPNSLSIIYSMRKSIEILMRDMDEDEAREYFNFNVLSAYVGEKAPIFCDDEYEV